MCCRSAFAFCSNWCLLHQYFYRADYATGFTLFYYDQRVRKEGFDIEWMMQAAGLRPAPEPPVGVRLPPRICHDCAIPISRAF